MDILTVKLNCFNWGGRLPSLAVSSLEKSRCLKPTVLKAVEKNLDGFSFMVHSALETYSQALSLSVGKIKRTILTGIEYLPGAPTSAILLSDMDVYIVKSLYL